MRNSKDYKVTLPVVNGVIQDPQDVIDQLRKDCATNNQHLRALRVMSTNAEFDSRFVIDLKYRGPRMGNYYTTLRDCAYAVDVYQRLRKEWR